MRTALLALLLLQGEDPLGAERRKKIDDECRSVIASSTNASARGDAFFKLARFAEAADEYDKMVEAEPGLDAGHWRRGIAWFYAGRFEKAAGQFERYHSFDNVDRENGIWRYFSQRRAFGKDKAQEGLLKYEKDDREPFPDVYALFQGKRTPEQILEKINGAKIGDEDRDARLFYAHLYIGLNFAVEDKPEQALPHLRKAVANTWGPTAGYGPTYMWHVGRVHYDLLSRAKKKA